MAHAELAIGQVPQRLGSAVEEFLAAIEASGYLPRVLVIDSLSDGYGLGSAYPRILADAVCKFAAEKKLVLILLEETTSVLRSNWTFATDVVIELDTRAGDDARDRLNPRTISIGKNRFGPSDPGPHTLRIRSREGPEVLPRGPAYLQEFVEDGLFQNRPVSALKEDFAWSLIDLPEWLPVLPSPVDSVTLVAGPDHVVPIFLERLVALPGVGIDIRVDLGKYRPDHGMYQGYTTSEDRVTIGGNPYFGEVEWLNLIVSAVQRAETSRPVKRIIIGNLAALAGSLAPDEVTRALYVAIAIFRNFRVPIFLHGPEEAARAFASTADIIIRGEEDKDGVDRIRLEVTVPRAGFHQSTSISLLEAMSLPSPASV